MSHVDEGTLHAFLDGALDAVLPAGEAAKVREHLALCDACAVRLGEERAARGEAAELLGLVAPPVVDPPSFEEVRAMARSRRGARASSRHLWQLGWAASLVLAVGAGWLLRGASVPLVVQRPAEAEARRTDAPREDTPRQDAPLEGAPTPAAVEEDVVATDAAAPRGAMPDAMAPDPVAPSRTAPESSSAARSGVRQDAAERPAVPAQITPAAPTLRAKTEAKAAIGASQELRGRPERAPEALRPEATPDAAGAAPGFAARSAVGFMDEQQWPPASAALAVPGVEVLSVTEMGGVGLAGAVRVLQLVAPGDTLELVYLPGGTEPSVLPPIGDGRTEVIVRRAGGWLVARGAGDPERLQALVRRLDGGR